MNVWLWGPPMWTLLQTAASLSDTYGTPYEPLVRPLNQLLPCRYCRESYQQFYKDAGVPKRKEALVWIYQLHKRVNRKLWNQRVDKFVDSLTLDPTLRPMFADLLKENADQLLAEPSLEILQKRFMLMRDEVFSWSELGTVLLAFVMGLQVLPQRPQAFSEVPDHKRALIQFIKATIQFVKVSRQSNSNIIVNVLESLKDLLQKQDVTLAEARLFIETAKYSSVTGLEGPLSSFEDASRLLQAGACMHGTCV